MTPALRRLALTAITVPLLACGSDGLTESEGSDATVAGGGAMDEAIDDMNMGDPGAVPAADVAGASLARGTFIVLDTRPEGYDSVTGSATIARHDGGTTVTTEVSGLQPNTEYVSHVHEQACGDDDDDGGHYQYEVDGSELPPNEIHLRFTTDDQGTGFMTAENAQVAGTDAVSFVVHTGDEGADKIACVDFVDEARQTSVPDSTDS